MNRQVLHFRSTVGAINKQIESVNKRMAEYVKQMKSNPSSFGKTEKIQKKENQQINQSKKTEKIADKDRVQLPSAMGVDYKLNPIWLKIAEYFGIDDKEYSLSVNKIAEIADWAVKETNSHDLRDVLLKVADVSKRLPSPGMSEKRYAILHRHIRMQELENEPKKKEEKREISTEEKK